MSTIAISNNSNVPFDLLQNFRVLKFNFKQSEVGEGKRIAEALTQFAFPNQHNKIFSYNYKWVLSSNNRCRISRLISISLFQGELLQSNSEYDVIQ